MMGENIQQYNILRELGRGGMATVYLAHDQKFDTNVAIKVLNKEFVHNDNIRKRFLAEAKSMFKMSHPNIIKVTDLIDAGDNVAFAMEYIEGETLKEYIDRKGKLKDDEIRTIFTQMLEAVGYVHKQNLVHRDIKPSNFMIDREGGIKLMDFGIAKTLDPTSSEYTQTGTGMQMGTPMYMSPEQITETKSVTAQSDIYSLGVVLWQMVTGQRPYDTKTLSNFQLQNKIVNEVLVDTRTGWDSMIRRSTLKEAMPRYKSCQEWLNEMNSGASFSGETEHTVVDASRRVDTTQMDRPATAPITEKERPRPSPPEASKVGNGKGKIVWVLGALILLAGLGYYFLGGKSKSVQAQEKKPYEPEMVAVEGGTFMMGSNSGEDDEKPIHEVTLSSFTIGKYEVTQAQWQAVMGNNPSVNKGCDNCPVQGVSWNVLS